MFVLPQLGKILLLAQGFLVVVSALDKTLFWAYLFVRVVLSALGETLLLENLVLAAMVVFALGKMWLLLALPLVFVMIVVSPLGKTFLSAKLLVGV